jgi:hypothetical protein
LNGQPDRPAQRASSANWDNAIKWGPIKSGGYNRPQQNGLRKMSHCKTDDSRYSKCAGGYALQRFNARSGSIGQAACGLPELSFCATCCCLDHSKNAKG